MIGPGRELRLGQVYRLGAGFALQLLCRTARVLEAEPLQARRIADDTVAGGRVETGDAGQRELAIGRRGAAPDRVEQETLSDHLQHCVAHAFLAGTESDRQVKIDELLEVLDSRRR